ncbi:MAG: sugar phosphate isomerase/epimerase family protein [Phycisphaerales bacterium JB040]
MPSQRRDFLKASAGALAAAAVPASFARQPDQGFSPFGRRAPGVDGPWDGPPVRMALKYSMIGAGETIAEKFAIAREAGFQGVELPAPSDLNLDEAIAASESSGLTIIGVVGSAHWAKPLSHADPAVRTEGRHALENAILDCKTLGGSTVLLVPAVVDGDTTYQQAWDNSLAEIHRVVPFAREHGIRIALENVWNNFLLSPLETREYIQACNRTSGRNGAARQGLTVGAYLDIGNLWNTGWPSHWVEALGPAIMRLDVKGYSRDIANKQGKWAGFNAEIGDGDLPWEATCAALRKANYTGWATAEVSGGDGARLKDVAERMQRVFAPLNTTE